MKKSIIKSVSIIIPRIDDKAPVQIAMSIAKNMSYQFQVSLYYINGDSNSYKGNLPVKKLNIVNLLMLIKEDIVHSHCFLPDLIAFFIKNIFFWKKAKFITTVHCDPFKEFQGKRLKWLFRYIWLFAMRSLDRVIVLNICTKKQLKSKRIKAEVIYNGKDIYFSDISDTNTIIQSFAKGRKIIGTYSVLKAVKGIEQLIQYAKIMDKSKCIIIAGDGELMNHFKSMLEDNELLDKVLLLGFIKNAYRLLPSFDVFVMTSRSEGFPIALIEALASGKPICHSNIVQFIEFKNKLGYLAEVYELDNVESLSKKLDSCLDSNVLKSKYLVNIKLYQEFLTERSMCSSYLNAYYDVY